MNIEAVRQVAQIIHERNVLESKRNHFRKKQSYFENMVRYRKAMKRYNEAKKEHKDGEYKGYAPYIASYPKKWHKAKSSDLKILAKTNQVEYEKAKLDMLLYTKKTHKQLCKLLKQGHIHLTTDWGGGYRSMYTHGPDGHKYIEIAKDKEAIAYLAWEATAEEMLLLDNYGNQA